MLFVKRRGKKGKKKWVGRTVYLVVHSLDESLPPGSLVVTIRGSEEERKYAIKKFVVIRWEKGLPVNRRIIGLYVSPNNIHMILYRLAHLAYDAKARRRAAQALSAYGVREEDIGRYALRAFRNLALLLMKHRDENVIYQMMGQVEEGWDE